MADEEPAADAQAARSARLERDDHGRLVARSDATLTDELLRAAIDAGRR